MLYPKLNALIYRNWERILIFLVSDRPGMERPGMGIDPTQRPGIPAIPGLFGREWETMAEYRTKVGCSTVFPLEILSESDTDAFLFH